ncbi:PREDICTED: protein NRT1/ PTR FAMILY 4.5-like isoform X2 [Nelumbo nucifera]|nr:PREDICTED: protein NRT1/ PTR FAMILY 4.5-like isoform X2 [Nelumbo nucifera]XP_019052150.1 PREDICTED: protein NRT1/ PTR FAMILY 4.5-like isoform X2 [Nelumbo nucifera]
MFIFVFTALENIGFVANMTGFYLYFYLVMHFDISGSANTLTSFMGSTYLLSLVGGFIADTYLSRLSTCLIFGLLEIVAMMILTVQAHYQKFQPEPCDKSPCVNGGKALMFYSSLCLLALGAGGVKGALPALGGDQFNQKDPKEGKALASFFNWLLLSSTLGATIGVTVIQWVNTNKGWDLGFFICTILTFAGYIVLSLGKPFYHKRAPGDSPLVRIIQVIVVAIRNRSSSLPVNPGQLYEINDKNIASDEETISHTNQFRFLDKAAILRQGTNPEPWRVCTVTQVEELKILMRMLPIIASTILLNTCLAQLQTFSVQQGSVMNRRLGKFLVPAPSIPVIPLVFISILIPIYQFIFVPFARRITHRPSGITHLQRVGFGLVLSIISMAIAGVVEVKRRDQVIKDPTKPISLFWLSFQYGVFGFADMFTLVGLLEFYYKEAPSGMRSLSTSFAWLSQSIGYFLSSVFVELINSITKRFTPSKQGWLEGIDLNKNNLNLFYWFLAVLSCLNFANYCFWASWYKCKSDSPLSQLLLSKVPSGSSPVPFHRKEISMQNVVGTTENGYGISTPGLVEDAAEKQEEK